MIKSTRSRLYIILICFFVFVMILLFQRIDVSARSNKEDTIIIENVEDLYIGLSNQIINGQKNCTYYTNSDELISNIKKIIENYNYYNCSENPLWSGTYLNSYVTGVQYTYWQHLRSGEAKNKILIQLDLECTALELQRYFEEIQMLAPTLVRNSQYESVKAVHNYIIKRVDYDNSYQNYLDFEGFRDGKMVCNGYCMAMYALLVEMDIPVRIITGTAGGPGKPLENHAWNAVCVDGKWYNVDATWDDLGGEQYSYDYFLVGKDDFKNHNVNPNVENEYNQLISERSYKLPFGDKFRGVYLYRLPQTDDWIYIIIVFVGFVVMIKNKIEYNKNSDIDM